MNPVIEKNLFRSDDLVIDFFSNGTCVDKIVAFTFTPHENNGDFWLNGTGYAGDFLLQNNFDVVAFKSAKNLWYQNLTHETLALIERFIDTHPAGHTKRVGYGSSMGAYAAIQFSRALKLNTVLAISPQLEIDKRYDRRWAQEARQVNFRHRIDKHAVWGSCRYFIAYDPETDDALHVKKFRSLVHQRQLEEIRVRFSGHPTTTYFAETGIIKDIALSVLRSGSLGAIDVLSRRRHSAHYLLGLSGSLTRRRKYRSALIAIDKAISLGANTAEFHLQRCQVLHGLGRHEEALRAQDDARRSIGDDVHLQVILSHHLAKYLDFTSAMELAKPALQRFPSDSRLMLHVALLHIMHGGLTHWARGAVYALRSFLLYLKLRTLK